MAAEADLVWAIDIGSHCLKALCLTMPAEGQVEVIDFACIAHDKILSGAGVGDEEREELVALSLRRFLQEYNPGKSPIIVSVPSQNAFSRFVTLPPVESKRIPEIVQFEATQQIPFDLEEVQWDWQMMSSPDTKDNEVGIFAIKNEIVMAIVEQFSREDISISFVQMSSMALYNYVLYDRPELFKDGKKCVVVLNIGASGTDLIICSRTSVWQRSITIGGNNFTEAISETFKINFAKAEKLKRKAPMSKYARQIFQSMKPVFTELASEIQRSIGFYSSSHSDSKVSRVIAFGGGTRMRGLLKYLQQTLQVPVERPDAFKQLSVGEEASAAKFHENVFDFGVVYGLGLQGLGLGRIESNLIPRRVERSQAWKKKSKYFLVAASLLLAVSVFSLIRTGLDRVSYAGKDNAGLRMRATRVINTAKQAQDKLETERQRSSGSEEIIERQMKVYENRDVIPALADMVISTLPNAKNNPEQKTLYEAFSRNDVEKIKEFPRSERKQIFLTGLSIRYADDISTVRFESGAPRSRITRTRRTSESSRQDVPVWERTSSGSSRSGTQPTTESGKPGFLVSVTGYTPYRKPNALLDPSGVKENRQEWGIVTRLENADSIVDGNSPFELYKKGEVAHFSLKVAEIDVQDAELPAGTGVVVEREGYVDEDDTVEVIVDPMTNEVMSRVAQVDASGVIKKDWAGNPEYKTNDYWFELKFKVLWEGAPDEAGQW